MLKPTILKLKTYLNWDPEAEIDYIIKNNFPKYYNEENQQ